MFSTALDSARVLGSPCFRLPGGLFMRVSVAAITTALFTIVPRESPCVAVVPLQGAQGPRRRGSSRPPSPKAAAARSRARATSVENPNHTPCEGNRLISISKGHFGDVDLAGVSFLVTFEMRAWSKIYVSDKVSDRQNAAVEALLPMAFAGFQQRDVVAAESADHDGDRPTPACASPGRSRRWTWRSCAGSAASR